GSEDRTRHRTRGLLGTRGRAAGIHVAHLPALVRYTIPGRPGVVVAQRPGYVHRGAGVAFSGGVRRWWLRAGSIERASRAVVERRRRDRGGPRPTPGGHGIPGPQILLRLLHHQPPARPPNPAPVLGRGDDLGRYAGHTTTRQPRAPSLRPALGRLTGNLLGKVPALDAQTAFGPRRL
ncbi:MAG: hypothetical protein AVDCRST_MAG28-2851, partial [uncultured Rubrobacteraceae bacterium]